MCLIESEGKIIGRYVYVKNNKTKAGELGHWKDTKKLEVVATWLATGNLAETARITMVPVRTIEKWRVSDWWKQQVNNIQSEEDQKLDAKSSKVIERALDHLMDRIENGEFIYDQKTGQVIRTPAKLRDLNTAFNTLLDKRQLLRNKPTKIVEQQQTATQLQNLAEQFAKFVKNTAPKEVEYIEGETVVQNEEGVWEVKDE
jgi:RNA polymerase-binding transcription factor DksA